MTALNRFTQAYGRLIMIFIDYRESNLVLMDILVNSEKVDALSQIVHHDRAVREPSWPVIDWKKNTTPDV